VSLEVFTDPVPGVHTGRGHRPSFGLGWTSKDDPVAITVSAGWSTLSSSTTSVDANWQLTNHTGNVSFGFMDEFGLLRAYRDYSGYDVAQVCPNGHVVNTMAREAPQHNQEYCLECGEKTITQCPSCRAEIQGRYYSPNVVVLGNAYVPPAYCGKCGAAFPWTGRRLEAAAALANDLEGLSEDERQRLALTLPDLVRDVPMTKVSADRFKRLVAKAGPQVAEAFRELLVDIASETAKKTIWG